MKGIYQASDHSHKVTFCTQDNDNEDLHIDSEVCSEEAHPLYGALSWQWLDLIKLAYNPFWLMASSN